LIQQIKSSFDYLLSLNIIDKLKEMSISLISILESIIENWGIVIILVALLVLYIGLAILFKIIKLAIIAFAIALIALYGIFFFGFRLNISSSMPIGIYKLQSSSDFKKGDLVEVCLPANLAKYGFDRGYISKGSCSNGYAPLIKEVIATPNDYVVMNQAGITVNKVFYDFKQQQFDSQNRALTPQNIDQKIAGFLLIGNNSKNSWDSRYFGVIDSSNINGRMQKIISFN
jgi:conjugative transfer signal peptidase TraF